LTHLPRPFGFRHSFTLLALFRCPNHRFLPLESSYSHWFPLPAQISSFPLFYLGFSFITFFPLHTVFPSTHFSDLGFLFFFFWIFSCFHPFVFPYFFLVLSPLPWCSFCVFGLFLPFPFLFMLCLRRPALVFFFFSFFFCFGRNPASRGLPQRFSPFFFYTPFRPCRCNFSHGCDTYRLLSLTFHPFTRYPFFFFGPRELASQKSSPTLCTFMEFPVAVVLCSLLFPVRHALFFFFYVRHCGDALFGFLFCCPEVFDFRSVLPPPRLLVAASFFFPLSCHVQTLFFLTPLRKLPLVF